MANFAFTNLSYNAEGWGPSGTQDSEVPCHPFKKDERFGRPVEWWGSTQRPFSNLRNSNLNPNKEFDEDTSGFTFVDTKPQQRTATRYPRTPGPRWTGRGRGRGRGMDRFGRGGRGNKLMQGRRDFGRRVYVHRTASVEVRPNWKVLQQFSLTDLAKLECKEPEARDVKSCGILEMYDAAVYDKVNLKQPPALGKFENKCFYSVTTTFDPIIRELSSDISEQLESLAPEAPREHKVFATDGILAAIMAATRSVNSWDFTIEVMDVNGSKLIFLDKRDEFDFQPVNETSREPPNAEESQELSEELTRINQQFSQQILKKPPKFHKIASAKPNPFSDEKDDAASVLYRYRQWKLTPEITLVARCTLDGASQGGSRGGASLYCAHALLEVDPKTTNWRQKLDTAAGSVLATEIKNNACLIAKWTAQALLAGADHVRIGFVARTVPTNRENHQVLACQHFQPMDFALQNIALNPRHMWALVRTIVDQAIKLPEGRYVLMRDPNKAVLYLYSVPADYDSDEEPKPDTEDFLGASSPPGSEPLI